MNSNSQLTWKAAGLLVMALCLFATTAQAQVTDSTYQKQELNTGMPPASVPQPVIVTPPPPPAVKKAPADTVVKEKVKIKEKDETPFRKKLFTGGGFGLSFGNQTSNVQVSPILGYRISERFSAGLGMSYFYFSSGPYDATLLGGKAFAQAMVYKEFFAHVEYEKLSDIKDFSNNVAALLTGAGYRQMVSDRVGFDLMLLIDLNQNSRSLYSNPIFRGGLIINLF
ncbi:hypothetical protein [Adhaeribacter soli]|uniref:Outer membrane protein beta-barrel domain-containing protein n=1 Tax=Adhaeribacter soli TaxID=2607655 RepID=A0A5N1IT72_9BACT|nr:hypothetical protein [Adhaeribacter soli]KAA9332848.1 hypothetical protein F0P94_12705 [Adhaeribacter soli]